MKKLFSYNVVIGTSVTPVVVNKSIDLDNNFNTIIGIAVIKITGTDDEIKILITDDEKTIFNKSPLSSCYQVNIENDKTNLFRKCFIPIVNNNINFTFTADSITTETNFDIIFLLAHSTDIHLPIKSYDFQLQKFAFASGQTDWTDGTIHGAVLAKFKDTHQRVVGILIQCPVAGHIGIKDGNNNYLINRISKDFLQYNSEVIIEDRFYPVLIENIRNLKFSVEFKPASALEADTYIDVVFLLEKDLPNLNGLGGKNNMLVYTIKKPKIDIDGKESSYYNDDDFTMHQERVPGVSIHGQIFYNIRGELTYKNKKYYLFAHFLMPHVCMFEDEDCFKLVGYQLWKKNDLQLFFYI